MHRRTKIVCTIGPATRTAERIEALIQAGMNVARLNFSHEQHDSHGAAIKMIRAEAQKQGKAVAILQDLAGPKIRTGKLTQAPVHLKPGAAFILTSRDVPGDEHAVSLTYKDLPGDVEPGGTLLLSDGALELQIEKIIGQDIHCRVIVGGPLGASKGINLPEATITAPILSDKDKADLAFGLAQGVDYVAISFVRNAQDVLVVREAIDQTGSDARLIAKIEKHEALNCIDDILPYVDGLMVARGDLGVEIPIEEIPRNQKKLISKANAAGVPVITATQMLMSMVSSPRPTRAEVNDVANAILDGSDAVMLSEESAIGQYPIEAVSMLDRIACHVEADFPYNRWGDRYGTDITLSDQEAVAASACQLSQAIGAVAIATSTVSGSTTRMVAKYRPRAKILALTPNQRTYQRLALVWGADPLLMNPVNSDEALENQCLTLGRNAGHIKDGDAVVITAGMPLNVTGTTNLIKIVNAGTQTQ